MHQTDEQTKAGLNLIAQALTIYDSDLRLAVCNAPFQNMFDLPDHLVTPGAAFEETIRHLADRGEYGEVEDIDLFVRERVEQAQAFQPHYMERTRANGRTISVEGSPLPQGGWVTVYTDITRTKQQEALLRARSDALSEQVIAHAEQLSASNRQLAAMITRLEETKRQLTESEARTRLTTEMMPAHIAHVDPSGLYHLFQPPPLLCPARAAAQHRRASHQRGPRKLCLRPDRGGPEPGLPRRPGGHGVHRRDQRPPHPRRLHPRPARRRLHPLDGHH